MWVALRKKERSLEASWMSIVTKYGLFCAISKGSGDEYIFSEIASLQSKIPLYSHNGWFWDPEIAYLQVHDDDMSPNRSLSPPAFTSLRSSTYVTWQVLPDNVRSAPTLSQDSEETSCISMINNPINSHMRVVRE